MFDFSKTSINVRPASSSRNNCPINVVTAFAFLNGFVQMEVKTRQKHGESPPVVGLADWIAQRTFGTLWTNSISNATYNPKVIFETEFLCLSFVSSCHGVPMNMTLGRGEQSWPLYQRQKALQRPMPKDQSCCRRRCSRGRAKGVKPRVFVKL